MEKKWRAAKSSALLILIAAQKRAGSCAANRIRATTEVHTFTAQRKVN